MAAFLNYAELMINVSITYTQLMHSMLERIATISLTSDIKGQLSALTGINFALINMPQRKSNKFVIKETAAASSLSVVIVVDYPLRRVFHHKHKASVLAREL